MKKSVTGSSSSKKKSSLAVKPKAKPAAKPKAKPAAKPKAKSKAKSKAKDSDDSAPKVAKPAALKKLIDSDSDSNFDDKSDDFKMDDLSDFGIEEELERIQEDSVPIEMPGDGDGDGDDGDDEAPPTVKEYVDDSKNTLKDALEIHLKFNHGIVSETGEILKHPEISQQYMRDLKVAEDERERIKKEYIENTRRIRLEYERRKAVVDPEERKLIEAQEKQELEQIKILAGLGDRPAKAAGRTGLVESKPRLAPVLNMTFR